MYAIDSRNVLVVVLTAGTALLLILIIIISILLALISLRNHLIFEFGFADALDERFLLSSARHLSYIQRRIIITTITLHTMTNLFNCFNHI